MDVVEQGAVPAGVDGLEVLQQGVEVVEGGAGRGGGACGDLIANIDDGGLTGSFIDGKTRLGIR